MSGPSSPRDLDEVIAKELNRIRGQLCGYLEALGLPDKQERGAISTLKTLTYDAEARIKEAAKGAN